MTSYEVSKDKHEGYRMMLMSYLEEVVEDLTNLHHNDRKKVFENSCGYTQLLSLSIERVLSFGMHKSSLWASRNLYECIRAAARDIVIIESYPNLKHDWSTVDILNLSKPGRSRAWIRHAMNQGHLGDSILAMAGNFDFSDSWFQEFSIMRQPRDIKQVYEWLESLSMFEWNLNVNDRSLNDESLWTDSTPEMLRQRMKLTRVARVKASPRKSSLESNRTPSRDANTVGVASRNSYRGSLEDNFNGKVLVEIHEATERISESRTLEGRFQSLSKMGAAFDSVHGYQGSNRNLVEEKKYERPEEAMLQNSPRDDDEDLEVVLLRGSPSRSQEDLGELIPSSPTNPSPPPSPNLERPNLPTKSLTIPSPLDKFPPLGTLPREVKLSADSPPSPGRKQMRVLSKGGTPLSPMKSSVTGSPSLGTNFLKSRSLQNFVALQTMDGEINPVKFQGGVQGTSKEKDARKHSLDIVLEQEKEKRKNFQFPDPEKFKEQDVEDEKQEKIFEKAWEETSMSQNVKNPPKRLVPKEKPSKFRRVRKTAKHTSSSTDFDSIVHVDIATQPRQVSCSEYFSGQSKRMDMSVYSTKARAKLERELLSGQRPVDEENATGVRASTGIILQLKDKDDIQLLSRKQGRKCFTCGQFLSNPKRCHYSGMLYCVSCCHSGKKPIPAKMVMKQDPYPYPVSIASMKHLEAMWEVPCIPLSHVPERYQTKPLQELHKLLQRVRMKDPSRKQIEALGRRQYLLHSWDSDYGCFHELTRSGCYGLLTIEDFHRVITEPDKALKEISALLSSLN